MTKIRNRPDESFSKTKNREGEVYENIEIKYPFCYKTKDEKYFFRYLEDGRFEKIWFEEKNHGFCFGTYSNSINGLVNEKDFYLKVVGNLNTIIENEEFETRRNYIFTKYKKYTSGEQFLSIQAEELLRKKEEQDRKEIELFLEKQKQKQIEEQKFLNKNDIILNDDLNEDVF